MNVPGHINKSSLSVEVDASRDTVGDVMDKSVLSPEDLELMERERKGLQLRVRFLTGQLEDERRRSGSRIIDYMGQVEDLLRRGAEKDQRIDELTRKLEEYERMEERQPSSRPLPESPWYELILDQQAVERGIAAELGVSESEVMLHDDEFICLLTNKRIADSGIVREAREFLTRNGVKLEALSRRTRKPSDTVIIVKDLPLDMQQEELQRMFEKFGDLKKVLIPPVGARAALIVFRRREDAREAYSQLHQELYLRWADEDVIEEEEEDTVDGEGEEEEAVESSAVDANRSSKRKSSEGMSEEKKRGERKRKGSEGVSEEDQREDRIRKKHKTVKNAVIDEEEGGDSVQKPVKVTVADTVARRMNQKQPRFNPQCFLCELRLFSPLKFVAHLRRAHSTVLGVHGYAIECACGSTITSEECASKHNTDKCRLSYTLKKCAVTVQATPSEVTEKRVNGDKKRFTLGQVIVSGIPKKATPSEVESLFSSFSGFKCFHMPKNDDASYRGCGFAYFSPKGDANIASDSIARPALLHGRRLRIETRSSNVESLEKERREYESLMKKQLNNRSEAN